MFRLEKYYSKDFKPEAYWDDKYAREHIAGKSSEEFRKQGFWPLLESSLDKEKLYLDAGCGIGGWILFLKEQGYNVEGIDIAARTVRALTEYNPDLTVKVASITRIPYADSSLDGVLAIGTLEYVEDKVEEAIAEVRRVLRPGGIFFVEVPVVSYLRRWVYLPLKRLEGWVRRRQGKQPVFSNYLFDRRDIKNMLEKAEFEIIKIQPHELPEKGSHYGLYIDFPFLRGQKPYQLNWLGKIVKLKANIISPWVASTGAVAVARKK
jgi:SAM-dependent methyltransferase